MNKRGMYWLDHWGEVYAFILLLIGVTISLIADSAVVNYIVIVLCGIIVGRLYAIRRSRLGAVFYLVVIGFLLGFLIGASLLRQRGHWLVLIIFFFIGCYMGNDWYTRRLIK